METHCPSRHLIVQIKQKRHQNDVVEQVNAGQINNCGNIPTIKIKIPTILTIRKVFWIYWTQKSKDKKRQDSSSLKSKCLHQAYKGFFFIIVSWWFLLFLSRFFSNFSSVSAIKTFKSEHSANSCDKTEEFWKYYQAPAHCIVGIS